MEQKREYSRDGRAPIPKSEVTSRTMSAIKAKNTKPELLLRKALWQAGIRGYRLHWKKAPGKPDISFPGKKIAIFVNGCFWHRCPYCQLAIPKSHSEFWKDKFKKNVDRDKNKISLLEAHGWSTITIWECKLKERTETFVSLIKDIIKKSNK